MEDALDEAASALASARAPSPFAAGLEQAITGLETERARQQAASASAAGRSAALHDLVRLLRRLEEVLRGPPAPTTGPDASGAHRGRRTAPSPVGRLASRFALDPFRVRIALRVGIAVCAAFLVPMVLGWSFNPMVAPVSFTIAAMATRGGVIQSLGPISAILLLGWLLADLALVWLYPHVGRMPLALLYPAAVAGAFAYLSTLRPQLAVLPSIGGLMAILPVFSGTSAPTEVDGTYSTMCQMIVGIGTGWVASRLLWPATAATLFRERAAAQLELCAEALRERDRRSEPGEPERPAAEFLGACMKQLVQLEALHGQARHEPVERALHDARRTELLALVQELSDAVFSAQLLAPARTAAFFERGDAALAPLREALSRAHEALLASMQTAAAAVRDGTALPGPDLADARDAAEARIDEIRARPELRPALASQDGAAFLVQLDSRRQLVDRQLAIEQWLREG